jgi:hypothetical protein
MQHPGPLGMLTGQDHQALAAIAECWKLYASGDAAAERAALIAIRSLLPAIQPQCRMFARELIAFVMDWDDRDRLWTAIAFDDEHRHRISTPLLEELLKNNTTKQVHEHLALDLIDARMALIRLR